MAFSWFTDSTYVQSSRSYIVCAYTVVAAAAAASILRSVWSVVESPALSEYTAVVTGHAVVFIFVILPLTMTVLLVRIADSVVAGHLHKSLGASTISAGFVLGVFSMLFSVASASTGWTLYMPALFVLEDELKTVLVLVLIFWSTAVFLGRAFILSNNPATNDTVGLSWKAGLVFGMFVLPLLLVALLSLIWDRVAGTSVFDYPAGSPIIYETWFWIFGHPEVYFLILPFIGCILFINRLFFRGHSRVGGRIFTGAGEVVVRIAFVSFFVWGHHLFAVGFTPIFKSFFLIASFYILIPMFSAIRVAVRNLPRPFGGRDIVGRVVPLFSRLSIVGFLIGGMLTLFFFTPKTLNAVHGTRLIVAHFHGFFSIFIVSIVVIFTGLLINSVQQTAATNYVFALMLSVIIPAAAFMLAYASGLAGALRRIPAVAGTSGTTPLFVGVAFVVLVPTAVAAWSRTLIQRSDVTY